MDIKVLYNKYYVKNDIYILETQNDRIIINNNYEGLAQLNFHLDRETKISLRPKTIIYSLYKEFQGNKLLIYSPEQEEIIIVNPTTKENHSISLTPLGDESLFSPIYYWNNDFLILKTYADIFYQINLTQYTLNELSRNSLQMICPQFFNFWNDSKKYNILTAYSKNFSFIFQENEKTIGFRDTTKNINFKITTKDDGWHDVEYQNNTFLFIYENQLKLIAHNKKASIKPQAEYRFLRAKFISDKTIVTLSSKPSNHRDSLLQIYSFDL